MKERRRLQLVFANLRQLASVADIDFEVIDLRWGLDDDTARNGLVLNTCLREVARAKPLFIALLGERYGWQPSRADLGLLNARTDAWLKEGLSATEMEIRSAQPLENRVFFLRDRALTQIFAAEENACEFFDEGSAASKLVALKQLLPHEQCNHYHSLEELADQVHYFLVQQLGLDNVRPAEGDAFQASNRLHERRAEQVIRPVRFLTDRQIEEQSDQALALLEEVQRRSLVLSAPAGGGLSTTAVRLHRLAYYTGRSIFVHLAASGDRDDSEWLTRRLAAWLIGQGAALPHVDPLRHPIEDLRRTCFAKLREAQEVGLPIVIILDGLPAEDLRLGLSFLAALPAGLIWTEREDETEGCALPGLLCGFALPGLPAGAASAVVHKSLIETGKPDGLPTEAAALLDSSSNTGLPSYCMGIVARLRVWGELKPIGVQSQNRWVTDQVAHLLEAGSVPDLLRGGLNVLRDALPEGNTLPGQIEACFSVLAAAYPDPLMEAQVLRAASLFTKTTVAPLAFSLARVAAGANIVITERGILLPPSRWEIPQERGAETAAVAAATAPGQGTPTRIGAIAHLRALHRLGRHCDAMGTPGFARLLPLSWRRAAVMGAGGEGIWRKWIDALRGSGNGQDTWPDLVALAGANAAQDRAWTLLGGLLFESPLEATVTGSAFAPLVDEALQLFVQGYLNRRSAQERDLRTLLGGAQNPIASLTDEVWRGDADVLERLLGSGDPVRQALFKRMRNEAVVTEADEDGGGFYDQLLRIEEAIAVDPYGVAAGELVIRAMSALARDDVPDEAFDFMEQLARGGIYLFVCRRGVENDFHRAPVDLGGSVVAFTLSTYTFVDDVQRMAEASLHGGHCVMMRELGRLQAGNRDIVEFQVAAQALLDKVDGSIRDDLKMAFQKGTTSDKAVNLKNSNALVEEVFRFAHASQAFRQMAYPGI